MCLCCPPAISALFCLWFRNGCSKASVAGALTFFPPNPPLYQFECVPSNDGEKNEEEKEEEEAETSNNNSNNESSDSNPKNNNKNSIYALSERQRSLTQSAKVKFSVDKQNALKGVTYKYVVPSSVCSARFLPYIEQMEALKLHNKKSKSYIATVIYRYTSTTTTSSSKKPMTLIYSHGNATDIGGMSFLHCYLAQALKLNVVMYDYSGYGESGYVL